MRSYSAYTPEEFTFDVILRLMQACALHQFWLRGVCGAFANRLLGLQVEGDRWSREWTTSSADEDFPCEKISAMKSPELSDLLENVMGLDAEEAQLAEWGPGYTNSAVMPSTAAEKKTMALELLGCSKPATANYRAQLANALECSRPSVKLCKPGVSDLSS